MAIKSCVSCATSFYSMGAQKFCSATCRIKSYTKPYRSPQTDEQRLRAIRYRAARKGISFDLTLEQYRELRNGGSCHYCAIECSPTLDRKDPAKGYVINNLVPACRNCNTVKNNILSYDEMLQIAQVLKPALGSR